MENQYGIVIPTLAHFADTTWQMWETAERAGLITANLMWSVSTYFCFCDYQIGPSGQVLPKPYPGLRIHISCLGQCVTEFSTSERLSWKLGQNEVSLDTKLAQILEWIDLPLGERPQLILG